MEDDKGIVDAGPLADGSTSAYEVLEKTPGAVAIDGNIYLNSSTPAVIQINGRQIKLSGEDGSTLLKSLPASGVDKVEILRTPSAKYDASSSGGILNIVLKKGVRPGSSGSVNASNSNIALRQHYSAGPCYKPFVFSPIWAAISLLHNR